MSRLPSPPRSRPRKGKSFWQPRALTHTPPLLSPRFSLRWLTAGHPDPDSKNLREIWLPALEWCARHQMASPTPLLLLPLTSPGLSLPSLSLTASCTHTHTHARYFSERVRQLTYHFDDESRATDAKGTPLSDEAVMEAADFGVFIDLASMPQHEREAEHAWKLGLYWVLLEDKPEGTELAHAPPALAAALASGKTAFERAEVDSFGIDDLSWSSIVHVGDVWFQPTGRSPVEAALFKHALGSLDVMYAHKAMASLLSTRLPDGVVLDRGCAAAGHGPLLDTPLTFATLLLSCVGMTTEGGAALRAPRAS